MFRRKLLIYLLSGYLFLVLIWALIWIKKDLYNPTGDEVHYWIYADTFKHFRIDTHLSYLSDFRANFFTTWPKTANITNTHTFLRNGTWFPGHSPGTSLVLIPILMLAHHINFHFLQKIFFGALMSFAIYDSQPLEIRRQNFNSAKIFIYLAFLTSPAMFILVNFAFPDSLAAICLVPLTAGIIYKKTNSVSSKVAIALLPTLRFNFLLLTLIFIFYFVYLKKFNSLFRIGVVSVLLNLFYNVLIYHKLWGAQPNDSYGPYSFYKLMCILLFDQRQGIFITAPITIAFIITIKSASKEIKIMATIVSLIIIVPVALSHQLGGECPASRFVLPLYGMMIPFFYNLQHEYRAKYISFFKVIFFINILMDFSIVMHLVELFPRPHAASFLLNLDFLNLLSPKWGFEEYAKVLVLLICIVLTYQAKKLRQGKS